MAHFPHLTTPAEREKEKLKNFLSSSSFSSFLSFEGSLKCSLVIGEIRERVFEASLVQGNLVVREIFGK